MTKNSHHQAIRVGNQTAFMASTPLAPFLYAVQNHFGAFEWFPDKKESGAGWDLNDINHETRRFIKETALANDITLTMHVSSRANPVQSETRKIFFDNIDFAGEIGAVLLNIHLTTEQGLTDYVQAILPICDYCRAAGLHLAIENTPLTSPEDFNRLFALLGEIKDTALDHIGMCIDLGHANLCSTTQNDYIGFLNRLDRQIPIIHAHVHENYGDRDAHLVIFTGPAAQNDQGVRLFLDHLAKRAYQGVIILEQWPDPPGLLNTARDRLIQLLAGFTFPPGSPPVPEKEEKSSPRLPIPAENESRFVKRLVETDQQRPSWRQKLEGIHQLLLESPELSTDDLVYLAIYLRFIGTGALICTEDGRHFRPSRHARLSQQIQEQLLACTTPDQAFILRYIYPWLPSYDRAFTRTEPLTRIRDIAHRNDIPPELKKKIKHTLQNKLHRCAGPEDLTTSKNILRQITAPGAEYARPFVEQFKIFHQELREFFNAGGLEQRLNKICRPNDEITPVIQRFLKARAAVAKPGKPAALLKLLTKLRSELSQHLQPDASPRTQNMLLADIGLADYAFVLLSEIITEFENNQELPWKKVIAALIMNVDNIRLNGVERAECTAITAELTAWRRNFDPRTRDYLLRLKATMDRSRRLADSYTEMVLGLFLKKTKILGQALRVSGNAVKFYCEGDIRASLIFQLSKLNALLLKNIRSIAGLPPWDVIGPGLASGRLCPAASLDDLTGGSASRIVLLKQAAGDENISPGISALILAHHLPHLSHLAIRARQAGVVLMVAEDLSLFKKLSRQTGKSLTIKATAESVTFIRETAGTTALKPPRAQQPGLSSLLIIHDPLILDLHKITPANGGAKADGLRRLHELARKKGADFNTPPGVVIPFGVMEAALNAGGLTRQYISFKQRIDKLNSPKDFQAAEADLDQMLVVLNYDRITTAIKRKFAAGERLMVRSSSSCEDLAATSGAGLYESIANVESNRIEQALRKVWASLWTRRAVLSRRLNGISVEQAYMAVLIQQMLQPDYSFVMHTVNPVTGRPDEIYLELVAGQGETLASAEFPGTPYRMVCDKKTGQPTMLAFADFSKALRAGRREGLAAETVDYSACSLSTNKRARTRLGKRLTAIGCLVEETFGSPQDIEGAIVGDRISLVQSRPQILAH
ncbi:PEP/pyruvate-binding domain-containing protein [Desulfobacterota bacterium M19]